MTTTIEPTTHHIDGKLADQPVIDALEAARLWADWAAGALRAWTASEDAYVDVEPDENKPKPRLISTTFIELGLRQSRAYSAIAAEERAVIQAGIQVGALPLAAFPSAAAQKPDGTLRFQLDEDEEAAQDAEVTG